jgi:hypothetical protein
VWKRNAAGRVLTFHLAGINNQNFLMRDEETGSFWQQVTGEAISGPLKGAKLELASTEEVTFRVFREEDPRGTVLAPVAQYADRYAKKDWEQSLARAKTVMSFPESGVPPRELVLGITFGDASRAYPVSRVLAAGVVQDVVGNRPTVIVTGPDGASMRAFVARVAGRDAEFYRAPGEKWKLLDSVTAGEWDFRGCAVSGSAQGTCLEPVGILKDYWFDWKNYHPQTTLYRR